MAGNRPLRLSEVALDEVLVDAVRACEAVFGHVRFQREVEPMRLPVADGGRLRQVFANLLTNAAEAQASGEIRVAGHREGSNWVITVRDEGEGIAPESARRLFEPHFTTKATGTGLGLALSRRWVERHGGTLRLAASEVGRGSTFEVRLPCAGAVAGPASAA